MKRIDQQKVKAKVTGMMAQLQPPEPANMDDVKRRAKEEFFRRDDLLRLRLQFCARLLRRAGVAAAVAACVLVLSFVYTICAPVTVSTANNFVRRATIWVNDALHLGLEFPVPVEDENTADLLADGEMVFDSVEAASRAIGLPLVHLAEESGAELVEVRVQVVNAQAERVCVTYLVNRKRLYLTMWQLLVEQTVAMQNNHHCISTDAGYMYVWENKGSVKGRMVDSIWTTMMISEETIDVTKQTLQYLRY